MPICMLVLVISIHDDVYEELSKRKKNRSFSSVIRELLKESRREATIADLSKSAENLLEQEVEKIERGFL